MAKRVTDLKGKALLKEWSHEIFVLIIFFVIVVSFEFF